MYKGSTFSSIILRPWVEVRPRIEPVFPSLKGKRGDHDTARYYEAYYNMEKHKQKWLKEWTTGQTSHIKSNQFKTGRIIRE
jgi:hypothetical protein